ncbi:MAG: FAD-binding oxidoreductase [Myxococcales bacterium]|nr:FAD-binding oxidoreductase [Myxococcales bacterium]MCB9625921.1 FAD-binding oxidoreductase [Sandaracinaceae bacterium]
MHERDQREKSHWGWGWADQFPSAEQRRERGKQAQLLLGFGPERVDEPVPLDAIALPAPRVTPPASLASICDTGAEARVRHTHGRNYPDILRGFRGDFAGAPDCVAFPAEEADVVRVLEWASESDVVVVPYGGGTSVVGGISAGGAQPFVSLDLSRLDKLLEVDPVSHSARLQAGASGPRLEAQLAEHGFTLRFFPQSFEFATLGGWIATRAGGHFAMGPTHIDDLVESTRTVTPRGVLQTRRLPGSGAGPSADRLILGSEGTLGVITEAWMRVRPKPTQRSTATCFFKEWRDAVAAVRALSQSGLYPANCRLLDAREAALNLVSIDGTSVLILGFEGADHAFHAPMGRALELVADHGGRCPQGAKHAAVGEKSGDEGGAGAWKRAFIDAPYMLNLMSSMGLVVDTFETACTWDRFDALHAGVIQAVREVMKREAGRGFVSCRFTHVYPDGPAPYFTFVMPGREGGEIAQWQAVKQAASDAIIRHGGTITHHHAVGRVHQPWYAQQVPELFRAALRGAKRELDPVGVMNRGVFAL